MVLEAGAPVTRLLADFLINLSCVATDLAPPNCQRSKRRPRRCWRDVIDEAVLSPVLRLGILDFIDSNLADPRLGPPLLMQRFPKSRPISSGCLRPTRA
jgi:hypothetical protein